LAALTMRRNKEGTRERNACFGTKPIVIGGKRTRIKRKNGRDSGEGQKGRGGKRDLNILPYSKKPHTKRQNSGRRERGKGGSRYSGTQKIGRLLAGEGAQVEKIKTGDNKLQRGTDQSTSTPLFWKKIELKGGIEKI